MAHDVIIKNKAAAGDDFSGRCFYITDGWYQTVCLAGCLQYDGYREKTNALKNGTEQMS